jgi:Rab3 GTPase-activating protein catalytic subunit
MEAVTGDSLDEVFEITDFTTSTEWERFIARLEEVIREWKLHGESCRPWKKFPRGSFGAGNWIEKNDDLTFGGETLLSQLIFFLQQ